MPPLPWPPRRGFRSPKPQPYKWDKGDNAGLQPFFREGGASPDAWEDADALLKAKDIDEVSPASHQRRRRRPSRPAS